MNLERILELHEGKTVEFKRDMSSPDGILKTLVAFANTAGGIILIGVEDGTKRIRGIPDAVEAEERLASIVADSILPRLLPNIEILSWRDTNVLSIQVHPSNTRPHYLQKHGPEAGTYVRVGSTNRRADTLQIEELRRHSRLIPFDEEPLPTYTPDDLDLDTANKLIARRNIVTPQTLLNLKVLTDHQGRSVPTIGGLLLFGRDRFSRFPDSWIQAGRFAGTTRTRILDSEEIRSMLPLAAEEAFAFVRKHLTVSSAIEGVRREERWSIPLIVVREAILNAIVHADYSQQGSPIRIAIFDDRIEIENPGLLVFGLTIEDITNGISKLRNRTLGRVFYRLGLIEQWASGIRKMTEACAQAGLDPPKFEELGQHFRVTLSMLRSRPAETDEVERQILALLKERALTTHVIAKAVGLSARATLNRLQALKARGLVADIGSGPHDPKRKYTLTDLGR